MTKNDCFEVKIYCIKEVKEAVCSFLMEHGALGAVEEEFTKKPLKRNGADFVKGYFKSEDGFLAIKSELKRFLVRLKKNFSKFKRYRILHRPLKSRDYLEEYKKHFKPIKVSHRIVVRPDFRPYKKKRNEKVIVINPEMAFGTGGHPTTRMCIRFIDEMLARRAHGKKLSLLDAGTGSGIIAIAAALLGIEDIYGFDIDKTAFIIAGKNIRKNRVEKSIRLGCHDILEIDKKFDIVVANILSDVLIKMKGGLLSAMKKGGDLILSGILNTQKDDILNAFLKDTHLKLLSLKKEKEWLSFHFKA